LTPANTDTRRLGLKLMTLRLLPGRCPAQWPRSDFPPPRGVDSGHFRLLRTV